MAVSANHLKAKDYLSRLNELTYEELADALTFKWFRMNTLYHIKNKQGKKVLFEPNEEQEDHLDRQPPRLVRHLPLLRF